MRSDFPRTSVIRTVLTALIASSLLCGAAALAQQVWKWVDKNGVVHYSDTPVPGAKRVEINVQTFPGEDAVVQPAGSGSKSSTQPATAAPPVNYESIEVWRPDNDSTISGSGGEVSVSIRIVPEIQPGHSVRLEMDGKRVSDLNTQQTDFQLNEVPRGTHTLSASIVTRDGKTLIQSVPVKFHVLQPVITPGSPARPPRPTPR